MDEDYRMIADQIRRLRVKKGYTQEQLAEAVDLSASHLSKVESGQRRIGMKAYLTILQVLKTGEENAIFPDARYDEENGYMQYKEIMAGCSNEEKTFLLTTLKSIKMNMKILVDESL